MKKLTNKEQKELLAWARKVLKEYLNSGKILKDEPERKIFEQKASVFVTLSRNRHLRGCIGEFEVRESLWEVVKKMVIEAATGDPRFSPVAKEELSQIKIEISVLSPLKKIASWREINLGRHGVLIESCGRRGTFLPQVATETGWDLETFLKVLCSQKCGLPPDTYKDSETKIYVYEAQVFKENTN